MRQIQNSEKPNLYFSARITEAMSKIPMHPLTIVEAPMGYGKTTSVREHVLLTGATLLWQNIYDDSKAAFWSGFCFLFEELDHEQAQSLAQLGFPDDSVTMHAALTLIKSIPLPSRTVIVIDDFHRVNSQETAKFITFLAANEIAKLHIVLISRYFEFFHSEELSLKGHLYHITKESFEFSQKEIVDYYELCGITLTQREADELYSLTDGWISALYLLMLNFKKTGGISTSVNIYNLIEQSIYAPIPDSAKNFLLTMSIFSSFTLEQASYIMPDTQMQDIICEVIDGNAFISYDPIRKSYQIHSLFKTFLTNELQAPFPKVLYQKAAEWYMQTGDFLLSMRYSYLGEDFDALLSALESDRGQSITAEHKKTLIRYFDDCPMKSKINHPYAVLLYARRMFLYNEIDLYKKTCEDFMMIYRSIESDDIVYKNRLLGEYELILSFAEFNDIEKMSMCHKQAYELLKGPSLILGKQSTWTYGAPSVLYLFYKKSGELLKEVHSMLEVMPYYYQITDNNGKGAEEIMSAERFYYMGDFLNAEIALHKAYQLAEEDSDVMLCVIFLHIKLCFIKGDLAEIWRLFQSLHDNIHKKKWPMYIHTIDICEAFIFSGLRMNDKVASWVKDGEFQNTRLLFPSLAYLDIVYGRVLLANDEYIKLLGRAQQFLETASVYPNLLAQIYIYIYIAAASARISREDDAVAALSYALLLAVPDKVYMPFVENGDFISPLLEKLQARNMYTDDIAEILVLYTQYQKSVKNMIRENSALGKDMLTERENEIAHLAAKGLSNREIGKQLYISENTVKTQLKSVFEKLGINSRSLLEQKLNDNIR